MLNIACPVNPLGYGIAGLNIVKSLDKLSEVALFCIGQPEVTTQEDADIISRCLRKGRMLDFDAPSIKIWHQHDMSQFPSKGKRIGFPIFELDEFNDLEKHHLNSLDHIFVCSKWAKSVVLNQTSLNDKQITVVPLGVDMSIFNTSLPKRSDKKTIFFNCGKWEIRKGHDVLCDIFNKAFEIDDDVELWLLCNNPFLNESQTKEWTDLYLKSKLGSKIKIFPRMQSQQEVYSIMSNSDCGVFPSRAEGWNLELLEMMACGKSVITTNYSAHSEFCTSSNAHLVDIKDLEVAFDGKWFHGRHGKWAKIGPSEVEQFVCYLRKIHDLKQNNQLEENLSGLETATQFSWDNSARTILNNV